ncbi:MAG: hypothetical protein P1V18_00880 [Candidatus Gracilibacteria bacterium]|nr:hypothetical protein [Candidatus Gracilibacteria bacterium]
MPDYKYTESPENMEEYGNIYTGLTSSRLQKPKFIDSQTWLENISGSTLEDLQWSRSCPNLDLSYSEFLQLPNLHVIDTGWPNAEVITSDGKKVSLVVQKNTTLLTIVQNPVRNFLYKNIYFYLQIMGKDNSVPHFPITSGELFSQPETSLFHFQFNNARWCVLETLEGRKLTVKDHSMPSHKNVNELVIVPGLEFNVDWDLQMGKGINIGGFQLQITKPTQSD